MLPIVAKKVPVPDDAKGTGTFFFKTGGMR